MFAGLEVIAIERAKKKRKAKLKENRLKRIKAGKKVPFSLANVSRKLSGIQNTHQFKTNAYNLNFNESYFSNVKYSASNLTNCKFEGAKLIGVDFIYTNLKRCDFSNAYLEDVIFFGVNLKHAKFKNTHLKNVYFINTNLAFTRDIDLESGAVTRLNKYPEIKISDSLQSVLFSIAKNNRIYKHRVLHVNKKKINMWIIQILLSEFSDVELIKAFSKLNVNRTKNSNKSFFTFYRYRRFLNAYLKK